MTGQKKTVLLARILPLTGFLLFMPPLVSIANTDARLLGIPSIVAYLFTVWLLLISAAYLLQRKLASRPPEPDERGSMQDHAGNWKKPGISETGHD